MGGALPRRLAGGGRGGDGWWAGVSLSSGQPGGRGAAGRDEGGWSEDLPTEPSKTHTHRVNQIMDQI